MNTLGNILTDFGNALEKQWNRLKNYAYKCRIVYANAFLS
jgi:hypothetical protein